MVLTNHTCPNDNKEVTDQSSFWDADGINWDPHRIGWAIAGGCAALTVLITAFNVFMHARNYTNRVQQRQIIRILYMPPVYAVISFFSYRYFRDYTYYSLAETTYEAVTLSAFLLLLIDFVASTAASHKAENAIMRKDKTALPIPFCCWRFRPTKAYFMYTLKWSVLQYVIIRPAISIAGVITQAYGVLCESGSYSIFFAAVYLDSIDFVSISIALYGLIIFYALTKEELAGRQPLAKFLSIKLIVFFTFYQGFVFDVLQSHDVIKATQYWTSTNIADGLNALATCIEMVFFSALMVWAYNWKPYTDPLAPRLGFFRALWDSINYADFAREIWGSLKFFVDYWRGKQYTHGVPTQALDDLDDGAHGQTTFGQAFGVEGYSRKVSKRSSYPPRTSYDETIRLQPYTPSQ